MSAAMSERPVSAALQKADDRRSKGPSADGAAHGENGTSATTSSKLPPSSPTAHSKKRRVVIEEDDEDGFPPMRQPTKPSAATTASSSHGGFGGGKPGGSGVGSLMRNGSSSASKPVSAARKVKPEEGRAGDSQAVTAGASPASGGMKKPSLSRGGYAAADDDDDVMSDSPFMKKKVDSNSSKVKTAAGSSNRGGSSSSANGLKKNGQQHPPVKKESNFKIPKRDITPSRPGAASPAGSGRPSFSPPSSQSKYGASPSSFTRPGGSSTHSNSKAAAGSKGRDGDRRRKDGDDYDDNFVKKKKPRPMSSGGTGDDRDFQDSAKAARRKRKMEEEARERAREEARKKRRREEKLRGSSASGGSRPKMKAKPEPSRRDLKDGKLRRASGGAGGGGGGGRKVKAPPVEKVRKFKEMTRAEKIEQAMKVYQWWEEPPKDHGKQWDSLEHNGAHFAPEYKPHGVKLKYDGEDVHLNPQQEEVATFYASMPLDGPQLAEQGEVFNENFFADFKVVLGKGHKIKNFKLLDFTAIREHLDTVKQIKRAATDGEKAAAKTVKEELTHKYSYAIVDDHLEKVGNYNVEPPGLFRGRGKHPKTGYLKARVMPCDMAINCAEGVCVPKSGVPGFSWQSVQHDPSVTWLAKWDGVLAGTKYMMLAASSSFKGKSDLAKYDKAMKLKGFIGKIRADYTKKLSSSDKRTKQIATAVWIIDKLALRVGGEKGEDEADTVGCCSLRVEHLTIRDTSGPDGEGIHEIELEFLGKDSMKFKETIDFDKYEAIGLRVFKNLQQFCKGKRQSEEVFDYLDPSILNQHLQGLMPGLTAKVFRTYNASDTLQNQLPDEAALAGKSVAEKVALYNGANREVAILCNHQRTVSNAQKDNLQKMEDKLKLLTKQRQELKKMLNLVRKGEHKRVPLKSSDKTAEDKLMKATEKAKAAKAAAKTDEEKVRATQLTEKVALMKKAVMQSKQETMHLFGKVPGEDSLVSRIKNWADKIKKLEISIRDRDDNKEVSLSTSKINYMDPRVSIAWCKRHEVPVEKVFAKTLRDKFVWAMNVPPQWEFSYDTLLKSNSPLADPKAVKAAAAAAKRAAAAAAAPPKESKAAAATPKGKGASPAQAGSDGKGKGKGKVKVEEEEKKEEEEEEEEELEEEEGSGSEEDSDDEDDDDEEDDEEEDDDGGSEEEVMPEKKRRDSSTPSSTSAKRARRLLDDDDE